MFFDFHTHKVNTDTSVTAIVSAAHRPSAGLWSIEAHPWQDLMRDDFSKSAAEADVIGETGLDKLRGIDFPEQQRRFRLCCRTAEQLQKPLILHEVRSLQECIDILKDYKIPAVLRHGWRSPKTTLLETALRQGWYIGCGIKTPAPVWQYFREHPDFLTGLAPETDDDSHSIRDVYSLAAEELKMPLDTFQQLIQRNFFAFTGNQCCKKRNFCYIIK